MEEQDFALIVDGGGTKTLAGVVDLRSQPGSILASAQRSGCNPWDSGIEAATQCIASAIAEAKQLAGIAEGALARRAAFAIAGTLDETIRRELQDRLSAMGVARRCRVFPDIYPVLLGPGPGKASAAIVAGTGSVALARSEQGVCGVAGGWGYLLGDGGSGYAIGREAIRGTLFQLETHQAVSPAAAAVMLELKSTSMGDIKAAVYAEGNQRQRIAAVAAAILNSSVDDKPFVDPILDRAASQLIDLLCRACKLVGLDCAELPVNLAGGLLGGTSPLQRLVWERAQDLKCLEFPPSSNDPLGNLLKLLAPEDFEAELQFVQQR